MRRLTRLLGIGVVSALLVAALPGVSLAGELDDMLATARSSTYTASRLTVSIWGGETQVTRQLVEHADGMEIVRTDANWSMTGYGKTVSMGEEPSGFAFLSHNPRVVSTRYTVVERGDVEHMRRPGRIVDVMEGDIVRASMVIDDRSGALLIQDFYTAAGDIFRRTTLSEFRAYRTYQAPMDASEVPAEVVMPEAAYLLPETVAGYQLADSYSAPGRSEQGYYTDGLFGFSLFILSENTVVTGFEQSMVFIADSGAYQMVPTAQAVRLSWTDGSKNFVLVGDLPPDHLADVLSELPTPNSSNIISRWLRRFFG